MKKELFLLILIIWLSPLSGVAEGNSENQEQTNTKTTTNSSVIKSKFQLGGYGEAVMQKMFYSSNADRYKNIDANKNRTHGRFDLPHVVLYMSYDFGRGWKMSAEIEFEHGGTGGTVEIENEETGEYETEIEKNNI